MVHGYAVHGQEFEVAEHLLKHYPPLAIYEGTDGLHTIVARDVWFDQQITGKEIFEVVSTKAGIVKTAFGLPGMDAVKARARRNCWIKRK